MSEFEGYSGWSGVMATPETYDEKKPRAATLPTKDGYIWVRFARKRWDSGANIWTWEGFETEAWEPALFKDGYLDVVGSDEGCEWNGRMRVVLEWEPLERQEK